MEGKVRLLIDGTLSNWQPQKIKENIASRESTLTPEVLWVYQVNVINLRDHVFEV